jgi:pimeloyl-ACP methyl ester carboxylesterase
MQRLNWLAVAAWIGFSSSAIGAEPAANCEAGVYRLADGSLVDVGPDGDRLRWRTLDGRTGGLSKDAAGAWTSSLGWTREPDRIAVSFSACGSGAITFDGKPGTALKLEPIETRFSSGGETLAGRLVLPPGAGDAPLVVLGHGSEKTSALATGFRQRLYPAAGVGVFAFDKRGTGQSSGKYTQDFEVLAADAAAALNEARRLAGKRASRVGFLGGSQAGWVLPLAAQMAPADFVIVGYGIADSPLTEDRTETLQDLRAAGWGPEVLAKAGEVTDATGAVIASDFTSGFERLNAVIGKYGREPWFKDLNGEFTGEVTQAAMAYPEAVLRVEGPKRDEGTTWEFDAMASLRRLRAPLLWMIAGADTGGAGEETKDNLLTLQREGRPVTIVVFPNTEHGIHLIRSTDGKREEIGYHPGFFGAELDFVKTGSVRRKYGDAEVHLPKRVRR